MSGSATAGAGPLGATNAPAVGGPAGGRGAAADANQSGGRADGEVAINTGTQTVSGWTDVEIRGGMDMMPASFDLGLTEHYPGSTKDITLKKGEACTVTIGGDLVITGWINRISRRVSAGQHTIRVQGRSRCQDLVDCSSLFGKLSTSNAKLGDLARMLAKPFAGPITVLTPDGDGLGKPEYFSVSLGETPWEIISQVASYEGLLVHDDARGDLVICKVGTDSFASGFAEGQNLQEFGVDDADDVVFSEYIPVYSSQDMLAAFGPGGNVAGKTFYDTDVKRFRPLIVISEQSSDNTTLAEQRASWECTRRRGRSQVVSLVCDSWRDGAGTLWTHNKLAPVDIPSVGVSGVSWIVASWAFRRSAEGGTTAAITLMPPDAFSVQPLAPTDPNRQIAIATQQAATNARRNNGGEPPAAPPPTTAPNARPEYSENTRIGYGI